ncbi:transmembrane protein 117-like isoform X2 [Pecten maximus]|uniref:transmembrane protein 117-like isoform X2 n=1 Tax=Pecten maximus TaxID=6579 RepID=UPI0014580E76|nr:transmembrane protein 117-like isoform X2 [Pecten maximus]XP_033752242.1 transmembrane protein 117-like isoform X2 [Pecten maximus]
MEPLLTDCGQIIEDPERSFEKHDAETPEQVRKSPKPILIKVQSDNNSEDTKHLLEMDEGEDKKPEEPVKETSNREDNNELEMNPTEKSENVENVKEPVKKEEKDTKKDKATGKEVDNNNAKGGDDDAITPIEDDHVVTIETTGADKTDKPDGKDVTDAISVLSLFMERDLRYYFQHPFLRIFIAYFVTFCNFLIYAEDPVAHSMKECNIPLIGNDFAFVCTRYPPNAFSLLKVVMWLGAIIIGCILGKILIHVLLLNKLLRLKMFTEDQGSWMIMFLCSLISIFIMSWIYNGFLTAGGDSTESYRISGDLGLSNSIFMKAAACGTWCGDFFTAWMVTDMMLQEKLYPGWAKPVRTWWNHRYNRIILFWVVTSVTSLVVIFVIATDFIQWEKLNHGFLPTNELSRAFLASFILVMDILIVCQDWDFPHFMSAIDIKMPGVNTAHIKFDIPKCLKKEVWQVHITGKWFNYGILFIVMLLDLNMWKNQIFYKPYDYGQYVDSEGRIHTVLDDYSLTTFNESLLTWSYRNNTINPVTNASYLEGDMVVSTRYYDYSLALKGLAFVPALLAFIVLGVTVWMFGRFKPSKDDPYAGRLKKRRKRRRFSLRNLSSSFRKIELRRKVQAVPKLLHFRRKQSPNHDPSSNGSGYPENWSAPADINK